MAGQWEAILSLHWLPMGMADRSPPLLGLIFGEFTLANGRLVELGNGR